MRQMASVQNTIKDCMITQLPEGEGVMQKGGCELFDSHQARGTIEEGCYLSTTGILRAALPQRCGEQRRQEPSFDGR
jgi:hypothetical protein